MKIAQTAKIKEEQILIIMAPFLPNKNPKLKVKKAESKEIIIIFMYI